MNSGGLCALDGSVLVLNKFYMAVHIISVRRAFCLLFKELAQVITIDDGQDVAFNFTSWREASQARVLFKGPDDEFIRTVHFEIEVPPDHSPPDLRPAPQAEGQVQSPQYLRPRR